LPLHVIPRLTGARKFKMRQRKLSLHLGAAFALALIAITGEVAAAATRDAVQGRALYLQYCASCHGVDGSGNGPIARTLTTPPTNLRLLSERYGNPLPKDRIARFIDGRAEVKAHGPRDMPVWGRRFSLAARGNRGAVKDAIAKLVAYLQSIQSHVAHASAINSRPSGLRAPG
jgi:mono/diheme cytochrome c family protein